MALKKVLIISYYWPPAGGPGVQRILKFSKFLSEFGWQPIVITPENGTFPAIDESLLKDVPENCIVYRTKTLEPFAIYNTLKGNKNKKEMSVGMIGLQDKSKIQRLSNYIRANYFIPDARKYWKPYVLKAFRKVIQEHQIDAILTSGPPHSTHLAGLKIHSKHKIPWIADFRDPWTNIYYNNFLPRTQRSVAKDRRLENKVVQSVDQLIVATNGLKSEFEDRQKNTTVVFNGFDAADLRELKEAPSEKFILSYIGNFKPNQNVLQLWTTLEQLIQEGEINGDNFTLKLTGKLDPGIHERVTSGPLKDVIEIENYVPHQVATQRMQESSLLLFIIPMDENNKLIITGKLFEYLASRTPLLAIGPPEGDADAILSKAKRASIIDYEDVDRMRATILEYLTLWRKENRIAYKHEVNEELMQFSRKEQTKTLANLLDKISSEK